MLIGCEEYCYFINIVNCTAVQLMILQNQETVEKYLYTNETTLEELKAIVLSENARKSTK